MTPTSVADPNKAPTTASAAPIPWEDRQPGDESVVWRYSANPVIDVRPMPGVQGIYNSAVVPFEGAFAGVFRTETAERFPLLRAGFSDDALHWRIADEPITFTNHKPAPSEYAYDPRVAWIEDSYFVTWCGGHNGPTISMARTNDFQSFERMENSFLPFNRNGVLFPRRVNGEYLMFSRPSDDGHTPFGDIYLSHSPDLIHWGKHRKIMARGGGQAGQWWQRTKVGAGPIPIETPEGWVVIYHGVIDTCNGFVYSMGVAILDLDDPTRVLYRTKCHVLTPEAPYEQAGLVPNVVFPCAALYDEAQDRLAVYYGAADSTTCLAFARMSELIDFTKANSSVF